MLAKQDPERVDIAIIGAGIAGSALAAALAGSGLSVMLLDRREGPLDTARGDHVQPAVVSLLARWGVLDRLQAAGAEYRVGTRWFDAQQDCIAQVPVPAEAGSAPWFLFLNHERIGTILLDRALEGRAQHRPGVLRWSLDRTRDGWEISWEQPDRAGRLACTVLVGADGTGSLVRSRLAIDETRHRYRYPIAVLYGRPRSPPPQRTLDIHLTESRMFSLIPRTGGWTKIGFPIDPAELPQWRGKSSKELQGRLRALCPAADFEDLQFGAIYPPVSQLSDPYRGEGAAALIGDACHAMHPARSMGMNTCFRVADRLAAVLGKLPPGFAESEAIPLLQAFEAQFRADLAPRLADNHAAGERMDTLAGGGFPALTEQLRAAAKGDAALLRMARRSAGLSS